MAAAKIEDMTMDMEAFQRAAKYTLVKYTDMHAEMKEEAMDICITAVEKYTVDIEKCTQVRGSHVLWRSLFGFHHLTPCNSPNAPMLITTYKFRPCFLTAGDQGPDGQEVWCTMACCRRQSILLRDHDGGGFLGGTRKGLG